MNERQLVGLEASHLVRYQKHFVHQAFAPVLGALISSANQDGLELAIASGYRSFEQQCIIWNEKYLGKRPLLDSKGQYLDANSLTDESKIAAIMRWSALPGTSRHHWGCDVDLYAKNLLPKGAKLKLEPWEYEQGGHQYPLFVWLQERLNRFELFHPYREDLGGVAPEPWHLSYLPIAQPALEQLSLETIKQVIEGADVEGKSFIIGQLNRLYQRYVLNISEVL